jgi:hypothetical protein
MRPGSGACLENNLGSIFWHYCGSSRLLVAFVFCFWYKPIVGHLP